MVSMTASLPAGEGFSDQLRPIEDLAGGMPSLRIADGEPQLVGGRCAACADSFFPFVAVCAVCGATDIGECALPCEGTLYSFSTIHVSSSRPTPYRIGYVDLPGDIRLLAPLEDDESDLLLDEPVRLRADGERWWFAPVGAAR